MPLGTEHALVTLVSVGAVALSAVFAGIWWNLDDPADAKGASVIVSPAPFNQPPFCDHRIETKNGAHQIIVRANPLPENPPPPPNGITIRVLSGAQTVATNMTDIFGCGSLFVPGAGSYVFEASAQETSDDATHHWWSNAVTRYYDGESPAFFELRLNNYARYA